MLCIIIIVNDESHFFQHNGEYRPTVKLWSDSGCILKKTTQKQPVPSVALESAVMVPELMKKPRSLLSAVPTVTGLSLTVNGFWLFLNCRVMAELSIVDPSSME